MGGQSFFGPLIYIIFTNNLLVQLGKDSHFVVFADDTTSITSSSYEDILAIQNYSITGKIISCLLIIDYWSIVKNKHYVAFTKKY
jgi:hypothetical protein